jgi:predicted kinase
MRGLPASGKSTKAKELVEQGSTVRINKDLLRTMLHFDKFTGINEGNTKDCSRKIADWFLSNGINIVIDDTNLNPSVVQSWKDLAKIHNAKIEYQDMETTIEECLCRDLVRDKKVGRDVIIKMALQYKDYLKGEKAVICDLDGTLCDTSKRLHYVTGEKKDWKSFFEELSNDEVRNEVLDELLKYEEQGHKIFFVSGRPELYREKTEQWLEEKLKGYKLYTSLIMRETRDKRQDTETKAEIFDKYLKNLNIIKVFDDRPSVIRMWKEKGLDVVDVGKGIEF